MKIVALVLTVTLCFAAHAQQKAAPAQITADDREPNHDTLRVEKKVDELLWYMKLGDIADMQKYRLASSAPVRMENSTGQGYGNPLVIFAYTFTPKKLAGKKAPMVLMVHGGVHAYFDSNYAHIIRELLEEGYVVVAPEYRGSTGFGKEFYDQIDYGGAEIDDTHSVRDWAIQSLPQIDPNRIAIMGWSHGGYHALMNILRWPKDYKAAYAGVPVSDLVMRMGYKGRGYNEEFARFIGKQAVDNPMEYRKRSPVFWAKDLASPLLIHSTTNDEDVNVMEVEHMIAALKAAGKQFEYKIYDNAPGAHQFNRIDTELARQSRREVLAFLAKYLK